MNIKTVYLVPDSYAELDLMCGIWCTTNQECKNMSMKDAFKNSKLLDNCIIDDSIKDYLIFTFMEMTIDEVYDVEFFEIGFDRLIEDCKKVEMIIG